MPYNCIHNQIKLVFFSINQRLNRKQFWLQILLIVCKLEGWLKFCLFIAIDKKMWKVGENLGFLWQASLPTSSWHSIRMHSAVVWLQISSKKWMQSNPETNFLRPAVQRNHSFWYKPFANMIVLIITLLLTPCKQKLVNSVRHNERQFP